MKTIRLILFVSMTFGISLAAADGPAPPPPGVPAGAVKAAAYTWSYADAQGHKWIYRQTPFGIARLEDKPDAQAAADTAKQAQYLKAADAGDSVRFERPGPFGTYRWERKKTDLNVVEQAAWDRDRAAAGK
ncbi:MAG: hypothetical protein ACLQVN_22220 [Bryobacteraceae bacterium]